MSKKICIKPDCIHKGIEQDISNFYLKDKTKSKLDNRCKDCVIKISKKRIEDNPGAKKKYYSENSDRLRQYRREYYQEHREESLSYAKEYRLNNEDKIHNYNANYYKNNLEKEKARKKKYVNENREKVKATKRNYERTRRRQDPIYKLKWYISNSIRKNLNNKNLSKNGESCWKYFGYSQTELKNHLENLFEHWMNWDNWGNYNPKTWNDSDPSTWTWQIDHIIPHSTFNYKSMNDKLFKECWALENLRPYSAKQNIIDRNRSHFT